MKLNSKDENILYEKLIILGDEKVGKTTLIDTLYTKQNLSSPYITQTVNCIYISLFN